MLKDSNLEKEKKSESMLYRLFSNSKKAKPQQSDDAEAQSTLSEPDSVTPQEEQLESVAVLEQIEDTIDTAAEERSAEDGESVEQEVPPPIDAVIHIEVSRNDMEAYITVQAPQNGGAEVSGKQLRNALAEHGIIHGISENTLLQIVLKKLYDQELLIASATPKQDGENGIIEEFYKRATEIKPHHNIDGTVDFKEMNIINEILEGAVICRAIAPTEGVDGIDIKGTALKATPGKPVALYPGENTNLNEDKTKLIASKSGHLIYKEGRFCVQTVFEVNGNVDNATGNISFCGDVLIKGDVREGFEIRSKGNVTVKGLAEGASIYADGSIALIGGFNGMMKGKIVSQKTITSKFLQNCTVCAKENITTESVINSNISCNESLLVTKGKGVIAGGSCTVLKSVEAKIIGTPSNSPTSVTVGITSEVLNQKYDLEKELQQIVSTNELVVKNLAYLELVAAKMPLSEKQKQLQESCNKQKLINLVREGKAKKQLEKVNASITASAESFIKAQTVYPSTKISIINQTMHVKSIHNRCCFRNIDGEIELSYF